MGGACCGGSSRKIILANNQQELKQYVDEEIKLIKHHKLIKEKNPDVRIEKIEKELIPHCEEISNNLGKINLNFKDFEDCRNLINDLFISVENEDYLNASKIKQQINKTYFNE
jgi:hypothetical protein